MQPMPESSANRNPFLKWLWYSGATFLLVVFVVTACVRGVHFKVGSTTIQFACEPIAITVEPMRIARTSCTKERLGFGLCGEV